MRHKTHDVDCMIWGVKVTILCVFFFVFEKEKKTFRVSCLQVKRMDMRWRGESSTAPDQIQIREIERESKIGKLFCRDHAPCCRTKL